MNSYIPKDSKISTEGKINPIKTFKLFVEGKRSEVNYFSALKDFIESEFVEIISFPRDSGARNSQLIKEAEKTYLSENDKEYTKIWIIFDIEGENFEKSKNDEALELLSTLTLNYPEIQSALSNPSFEYWVLLHLIDEKNKKQYIYNSNLDLIDYKNNKDVAKIFKDFKGTPFHNYKKNFNFTSAKIFSEEKYKTAIEISKEIKNFHRNKGFSFSSKGNLHKIRPFTNIDELIEEIFRTKEQFKPYVQFESMKKSQNFV